jgi:DnaK suppressor protein
MRDLGEYNFRMKNKRKKRNQDTHKATNALHPRYEILHKALQDRKQEVIHQIEDQLKKQLSTELHEQIISALDIGDHSILDLAEDIDLSLLEMRNNALKAIQDAIIRIKLGTYGICEECETLIPEKRLSVIPFARMCVTCQEKREILEKIEKKEEEAS